MASKTFTVDYDNPSDLKRLIVKLSQRRKAILENLGYTQVTFNGSKYNMDNILPVLNQMLDTDLSILYPECDKEQRYHVYVHCDPSKPLSVTQDIKHLILAQRYNINYEPFYVGKGTGDRYMQLDRNDSHRKVRSKIMKVGKEVVAVKILDNVTEAEAFSLESKLIDVLGLRSYGDDGLLVNLDEGTKSQERRMLYANEAKRILERNGFILSK